MTTAVTFTIPGKAVAFARTGAGTGARGPGGRPTRFTPKRQRDNAATIKQFAVDAMAGRPPIYGPVALIVGVELPIAASWSKKKRAEAEAGRLYATGKPDADNFAKQVMDSCNAILFADDRQVVDLRVVKKFGPNPRLVVAVKAL